MLCFGEGWADLHPVYGSPPQMYKRLNSEEEFLLIYEVLTDSGVVAGTRGTLVDVLLTARARKSRLTIAAVKENH